MRAEIAASLRRNEYQFRNVDPVVFLCGAENSRPRDNLREYLARHQSHCHVFYAERVWDLIRLSDPSLNLLQVEEELAALSDMVLVIVESPGTFAELGAFAMSKSLRQKLLPLLDVQFRDAPSFIRTGPVDWVDRDSLFAPSIWLNQERILEAVEELQERLKRIPPDRRRRVANLVESPKHLFFFVCDLVAVFGPCSRADIHVIAAEILEDTTVDVSLHLGLGKATGALSSFIHKEEELFYRPVSGDGRLRSFHRPRKLLDIPTLRLRMMASMQTSPEGLEVLRTMAGAG